MNPSNPWMPLVAAVVASAFTMASIYLGHRLTMARERASKAADSRMKRSQRWEEFEERTLLEFQDKAPLLVTCCRRALGDVLVVATTMDFSNRDTLMARFSEMEDALVLVFTLASRIRDDETRREAMNFFAAATMVRDAVGQAFDSYSRGAIPNGSGPEVTKIIDSIKAAQGKYLVVGGRIGRRIRAAIEAEAANRGADPEEGRTRQAGDSPRRWAALAGWDRRRRDATIQRLA